MLLVFVVESKVLVVDEFGYVIFPVYGPGCTGGTIMALIPCLSSYSALVHMIQDHPWFPAFRHLKW